MRDTISTGRVTDDLSMASPRIRATLRQRLQV